MSEITPEIKIQRKNQIKISKNPETQARVDTEAKEIERDLTNNDRPITEGEKLLINKLARKNIAGKIYLKDVRKERDVAIEKTMIDELTQLPNLTWFVKELTISKNKAERSLEKKLNSAEDIENKTGFFLILIDVDQFKSVNDTYGHPKGDEVLKLIAQLAQLEGRAEEPIARLGKGADEFAQIVNEGIGEEDIGKLIDRYRYQFAELTKKAGLPPQTLSYGIAKYQKGFTEDMWRMAADKALFDAKHMEGKNRAFITDATVDGKIITRELTHQTQYV